MENNDERQLIIQNSELEQTVFPYLNQIINNFNLPRNVIASQEEIQYAWRELPREINRIPPELRNELILRMCIATSVGLFDGAINYVWNAVIITLRNKINYFGLSLVGEILNKKDFDEKKLKELKDIELLELSYKLELLSEEGYYFLNQCRDIRNNFSVAHPSIANIDDRELITFISRCCKYGITEDYKRKGIEIEELIKYLEIPNLDEEQVDTIVTYFENTFEEQRQLFIPMLYSKYCDPNSTQVVRNNCLTICLKLNSFFNEKIISTILERHREYSIIDKEKGKASTLFFEKMNMIKYLSENEKHSIYKNACKNLFNAHNGWDNFYNEIPFAQRLLDISNDVKRPETIMEEYVYCIILCYVGNPYGVSEGAVEYYKSMIQNFSPKEIDYLLNIYFNKSLLQDRISLHSHCRKRYYSAIDLIDIKSLSSKQIEKLNKINKR